MNPATQTWLVSIALASVPLSFAWSIYSVGRMVNARRFAKARECYRTACFPGFPEEMQPGDINDWDARKVGL